MPYAELQVTTNYSFLRGGSHPGELVEQAIALGHTAIGITDRNTLAGVVRAYAEAKGKNKGEVQKLFDLVHEMVMTGQVKGEVGKLAVFAGVHKFPARVKCAILAWHAVMAALKGGREPVTTESEAQ